MIPKTKLQKEVAELSLSLPAITDEQTNYAYMKYFKKYAVLSRRSLYCLECGHVWRESGQEKFCVCPECSTTLEIYKRYNGSLYSNYYYSIITTLKGWQVIRMFEVNKFMRKKKAKRNSICEIMQFWINEKGKVVSMSIKTSSYNWNGAQWSYGSPMEVKPTSFNQGSAYGLSAAITYPKKKILPVIKRNGYKGNLHGFNANHFFSNLLSNKQAETLLKTDQINLFIRSLSSSYSLNDWWPSIRICIRNKYKVQNASDWMDYINLLKFFKKDILNKNYVCPENLKTEHDRYVAKKRAVDKKIRMEEQRKQAVEDQRLYLTKQKRFSGLKFEEDGIVIKFLETVEDFMHEGDALGHCVFTNEYHLKKDSLIMSARIDHKPIETIEVSLKQLKVIQSRGKGNNSTEHHAKIVDMVNRNMKLISKRLKAKVHV